jgi:hypothetical protein
MFGSDKIVKISQLAHITTLGLLWITTMYAVAYFVVGIVA